MENSHPLVDRIKKLGVGNVRRILLAGWDNKLIKCLIKNKKQIAVINILNLHNFCLRLNVSQFYFIDYDLFYIILNHS